LSRATGQSPTLTPVSTVDPGREALMNRLAIISDNHGNLHALQTD
jgi:hypothetical protein